jgi:hypothetical protein
VDHSANIEERIVTIEGLCRMSDEEIRRIPTIEMVYTNGFLGKGRVEDKHFQFLRRGYFLSGGNGDSSNATEQFVNHQSIVEPATSLLAEKPTNNQSTVELPRKKSQLEPPPNDSVVTEQPTVEPPKKKSQLEQPRNHTPVAEQSTTTPQTFTKNQPTVEHQNKKSRKEPSRSEPIVTEQPTAVTTASKIQKDVRPLQSRRRLGKTYSRQEKGIIKLNIQSFFNQQVIDGQIGGEELMYDPIEQHFRSRQIFKNGRRGDAIVCTTMDAYPLSLINAATEFPKEWIGPSISTTECPPKPKATAYANPPSKLTKSLVDTRPTNARKGTSNPRYVSWKIHCYFNKLRREKRLDAAQLKYMPSDDVFYVRTPDTAGRLGPVFPKAMG